MAEVDTGVVITDATSGDHPIVYVNRAMERMSGYTAEEMLGRNPRFLQGKDHDQPELDKIRIALTEGTAATALIRN